MGIAKVNVFAPTTVAQHFIPPIITQIQ